MNSSLGVMLLTQHNWALVRDASAGTPDAHVISDVCHADLRLGAGDADGPDGHAKDILLNRVNMLNRRAMFGPGVVAPLDMRRHGASLWLSMVDMAGKPVLAHECLVLL